MRISRQRVTTITPDGIDSSRRFIAYDDGNQPVATICVQQEAYFGCIHSLRAEHAGRLAAVRLIAAAGAWLQERNVPGVLIEVSGRNITRRFYRRLGFRAVHGLPGLMSAGVTEAMEILRRFL